MSALRCLCALSPLRYRAPTVPLQKSRKQARLLATGLVAVFLLSSAWRVIAWSQAEVLLGAQITQISETHSMRRSTGRRSTLVVTHDGEESTGRMTTYWWLGAPQEGERVDLRISRDGAYSQLHFDSWLREFGSSLLFFTMLGMLGAAVWWRWARRQAPSS